MPDIIRMKGKDIFLRDQKVFHQGQRKKQFHLITIIVGVDTMDSRDIFCFRLADRHDAKTDLKNYIQADVQSNILWISGCRGVGKTYLLENMVEKSLKPEQKAVLYSFGSGIKSDQLQGFLEKLQTLAPARFLEFLKGNYASVLDISKQLVSQALKITGIDIGGFISAAHDSAKVFVTTGCKQHSAAKVVEKYLEDVLNHQQLVIVFDHFSSCEKQYTDLFMQLMDQFIGNPNIRFIISTTDEVMESQKDMQVNLLKQLPVVPLMLKPFDEEIYFYEILEDIFEIPENEKDVVTHIFNACGGLPVKLQVALIELYRTNAIQLGEKRAKIDFEQVKSFLLREEVGFQPGKQRFLSQVLLLCVIALNECVNASILLQAAEYIIQKLPSPSEILAHDLIAELESLHQLHVITTNFEQDGIIVIPNPIIRETLKDFFAKFTYSHVFSKYLVMFLRENCTSGALAKMPEEWIERMVVLHTINGKDIGWFRTALEYGLKKYQKGYLNEANEIFSLIYQESEKIQSEALTSIANCFFAVGNYGVAESLMFLVSQRKDLNNWNFHFCYCRILNVRLKKEQAIREAKLAARCAQSNEEQIRALNMQQQIMVDTTEGKAKAKSIFLSLIRRLKREPEDRYFILPTLKCAIDFFHGSKAFGYLKQAKAIAYEAGNQLELAYILTNEGFECFRQGDADKAAALFKESTDILENIRRHEMSYPLSNLANCYMAHGDYDRAISILLCAMRWNQSIYISFTTHTLLMACYSLTGDMEKSERVANDLLANIQLYKVSDTTMLRKIYLNIALIYQRHGKIDLEQEYAEKAYSISAHTSSWYRAYQVAVPFLQDIPIPLEHCPKGEEWYWTHGEYEPWLVTFSHD